MTHKLNNAEIHVGDALAVLPTLPAESVHCCVTSPPYYGLRDYGQDGQIGLESTPDAYVEKLVAVFREVKRVLRDDGTCWLNLGDSYAGGNTTGQWREGSARADGEVRGEGNNRRNRNGMGSIDGLKPKDLIGIPWRVAFALQADGWYLRSEIIWAKPNPMPESVTDRPTKSHEQIFLLTKSARYFYDAEAVKEDATCERKPGQQIRDTRETHGTGGGNAGINGLLRRYHEGNAPTTRNKRSVWTVATQPFKEAHFATFPPALITPCILAGCPVRGTVLDPFNGAGTSGLVALKHNRKYIGVELNPEYAAMTVERIRRESAQTKLDI